jgi:hypothetical protein
MSALLPRRPPVVDRPVASARDLTPAEIKEVLRRENEARLSPETQARFAAVGEVGDGWLEVVEALQREVAVACGLTERVGVAAMRNAERLLDPIHHAEIREISLYRKYNRCKDGDLHAGDAAPNVLVAGLGGEGGEEGEGPGLAAGADGTARAVGGCGARAIPRSPSLFDFGRPGRPLVVFAGSYS